MDDLVCSHCGRGSMFCQCEQFHPNVKYKRLNCNSCGKSVSTEFIPKETDTPDKGLIIRAWISCPECIEKDIVKEFTLTERETLALLLYFEERAGYISHEFDPDVLVIIRKLREFNKEN